MKRDWFSLRSASFALVVTLAAGPGLLSLGCGDSGSGDGDTDSTGGMDASSGDTTTVSTSTASTTTSTTLDDGSTGEPPVVYDPDVKGVFAVRCTLCHHDDNPMGVDLSDPFSPPDGMVGSVNFWAENEPQGGTPMLNIAPGDPDNSFIMQKIDGTELDPEVAGRSMPLLLPRLDAAQVGAIRQWITDGANDDAFFADNVAPIFGDNTAFGANGGRCAYCHNGSEGAIVPNLTDPFNPKTGVVNVPHSVDPLATLVVPGNPDASVLVMLIETEEIIEFGSPMPLQFEPVSEEAVETVREWIELGAMND